MRFLITFCVGVAAAFAWQSYGDTAREMIASSYPQLGWLAPQATPSAQNAVGTIGLAAPASSSPDPQQLKEISLDLDAVRLMVDRLAAGQEKMARDLTTKLEAAERDILDRISVPPQQPAAAPARKPLPPPLQIAPAR
jgi:hypothetical protein